jgi:excisionase family DNA binding protein
MTSNDLFTAPQVAQICGTDLKTIHNWVNRGEIHSFRTPGRHLRFRRQDVQDFLTRFGYPMPAGFGTPSRRVVVIDGNPVTGAMVANALSNHMEVSGFSDHLEALLQIGRHRPDAVLVNGAGGPDMLRVVANIARSDRELPVIVYGSADDVEAKAAGASACIRSTDPRHVSAVMGDYLKPHMKSAS